MEKKLKKIIGLEVFANELRAAEISGSPSRIKVDATGHTTLPDGVISDGLVAKPEVFMKYLGDMLTENGFTAKDIVAEIINRNLILRLASFPKVPEDKIQNVIMLQAQDFIPIPLSELELSYVKTGESTSEDGGTINALLVAMKKNIIYTLVDTIQNRRISRYTVNDITICVTALADAVADYTDAGTYMIIYLSNDTADILIISGGSIVMARSAQIDAAVSDELNRSAGRGINGEVYEDVVNIIKNEFRISVNYFNLKNSEAIDKVYIYAQAFDASRAIRDLEIEFDTETEAISIDYRLQAGKISTADKYLGCIAIAAGKL